MTDTNALGKLVPGFDFLQGLVKSAGAALPGMGQWIAPTLDPDELDKRIEQLRTVQFWLEQNARLIATSIQALEVQRLTLTTLRTMNLPLADIRESMTMRTPAPGPAEPASEPAHRSVASESTAAPAAPTEAPASPAADPMQWWSALTQQFAQIATHALKDGAADAARGLATAMGAAMPASGAVQASPEPADAGRARKPP
nr:hypothetical protein [Rubrivivax sp.]